MVYKLVIGGRLPSLNEYTNSQRIHKLKGAKLKKITEDYIIWNIKNQLKGVTFAKANFKFFWIEPNKKRDKDNIAFAKKFIFDALVKAKVMPNDGWGQVDGWSDDFGVDCDNERVEIYIDTATE